MVRKESRRRKSTTRIVTIHAGCMAVIVQKSTIVVIVPTEWMATLTHTRVTTWRQERVTKTRSFRNRPDGVGGHSWNVYLQIKVVD